MYGTKQSDANCWGNSNKGSLVLGNCCYRFGKPVSHAKVLGGWGHAPTFSAKTLLIDLTHCPTDIETITDTIDSTTIPEANRISRVARCLPIAVAVAAFELSRYPERSLGLSLGIVDFRPSLGMIPSSCQYAAVCGNYPQCMDHGHCLEFEDQHAQMFGLEMNAGTKISNSVDNGRTLNQRFSKV
jgi:hypothetical protein